MTEGPLRVRTDNLTWVHVGDEIVLLDISTNEYLAANPSLAALWPLLEAGCDAAALEQRLTELYGLDADTARADVVSLVAQLREMGVLAD